MYSPVNCNATRFPHISQPFASASLSFPWFYRWFRVGTALMSLLLSCIHHVLISMLHLNSNDEGWSIWLGLQSSSWNWILFSKMAALLIWFCFSLPRQPLPASLRHAANNHQRVSACDSGKRGPVVASEEPRRWHHPRRAITEVPRVPRLAAQDPLPARERTHRKLSAAAAEHDRRHLEHKFLILVSSIACFTLLTQLICHFPEVFLFWHFTRVETTLVDSRLIN